MMLLGISYIVCRINSVTLSSVSGQEAGWTDPYWPLLATGGRVEMGRTSGLI